jgi:hypothetical protein
MSEVTVYLASDLHPSEHVVLQPDYESVVFDLAALREELADMQHWRDLALQFDNHRMTTLWHLKPLAVNPSYAPAVSEFLASPPLPASEVVQRLAAAEQRNAELRQEVATLHAINETPDENILWDVLNATVGIITRRAYPHALESEAHNAGAKVILDRRAGLAATHLKPTESGASE